MKHSPVIVKGIPSDTKFLLTENYSEIIIFWKFMNFTRHFWKKVFFPGDLEGASSLENYEKIILEELYS